MPSGRVHFKSNVIGEVFIIGTGVYLGLEPECIIALGVGGLIGIFLTPDYDLNGAMPKNILTKFNPWRWMWWPYRKLVKHRSFISHSPIFSTIVRILYILFWIFIFLLAIGLCGVSFWGSIYFTNETLVLAGLAVAAWMFQDLIHIFLDYF